MTDGNGRRYRVVSLLGEGGFGKVYRARMEGPGGFSKEVAIKLLHDEDFPETVRRRFRDEARILGLIRDRAIVSVDPPVQLSGHWAIVMEYVDGVSGSWLISHGALPATVALEIIQEVTRALDTVYRQSGPDGSPLRLLHRDLKPGNLQVSPTGAVKILDFGIARAEFGTREAKTRRHVGGTFGYIAPERIEGIDGPAGDIYSLGVVLEELVTGARPGTRRPRTYTADEDDPAFDAPVPVNHPDRVAPEVLALAKRMRSLEPEERPSAREVEHACARLLKRVEGPSLRAWAEDHVPAGAPIEPDVRVGTVLVETVTASGTVVSADAETESRRSSAPAVGMVVSAVVLFAVVALGAAGAGTAALVVAVGLQDAPAEVDDDPPGLIDEPDDVDGTDRPPSGEDGAHRPTGSGTGGSASGTGGSASGTGGSASGTGGSASGTGGSASGTGGSASGTGGPTSGTGGAVGSGTGGAAVPRPPPDPGPTYAITLTSVPMGLPVTIDGRPRGSTPVTSELGTGAHRVRIDHGGNSVDKSIQVGRRLPKRYVWRAEEDEWESGF